MLFVLSFTSFAATTQITEKFSHKVGPFESSKDFDHVVNMPFNLLNQGYVFISRSIVPRGDASVRNEGLTANSYSFTMHISKSLMESAKGEVIVTLFAEKGGNPGYVNNPNPYPAPGTPGVGTNWGNIDANNPPNPGYPQSGTRVLFHNKRDRITFNWSDELNGKQFQIRIYEGNGRKIKEKIVNSKSYTMEADDFRSGEYKWQIARNNRAGFVTDIPLVGSAFADWSNYSQPIIFRVERRDLYNDPNQIPYQPSPSPNTGNNNPNAGANPNAVYAPDLVNPARDTNVTSNGNINFSWTGSGQEFEIIIYEINNNNIVQQNLNTKNYSLPASRLAANKTYRWKVKQRIGSTWSDYSPAFKFNVISARVQMKNAIEAQYDFRDSDLAQERLQTLTDNKELGVTASIMLAESYIEQGNYTEALNVYKTLVKTENAPLNKVYYGIANCYIEMGNMEMAKKVAEKLIKEFPGTSEANEMKNILR